MKFTPTNEEAREPGSFAPFPAGEYDYTVDEAVEQKSRNGNAMTKLTLGVFNKEGQKRVVFEYLVDTASWKIRQFAASAGLLDRYDTGSIEGYEMVGRTGRLKLRVERSAEYGDQNKVAMFLPAKALPSAHISYGGTKLSREKKPVGDDFDDAIPF